MNKKLEELIREMFMVGSMEKLTKDNVQDYIDRYVERILQVVKNEK